MNKFDIRSATLEEIGEFVRKLGEKPYRAAQIFRWINAKRVNNFAEMTNLSQNFRQKIGEYAEMSICNIKNKLISRDKTTIKYLLELENSGIIKGDATKPLPDEKTKVYVESVLMEHRHGYSLCISSQAGCRMGCVFCATAQSGLARNLTAGEMAAQVYEVAKNAGVRISNIVIMGMGEPLDNYDNTLRFIRIINHENGANIAARHITLSTCGLVPKIIDLMNESLQITLAVSLHAPNDGIRQKLMPIAKNHSINELLAAVKEYADANRRVTIEYAMISGINDSQEHAKELAKRLRGGFCHVNLFGVNEVAGKPYKRSGDAVITRFGEILEEHGFNVTVRRSLGGDIDAACGQLAGADNLVGPPRLDYAISPEVKIKEQIK